MSRIGQNQGAAQLNQSSPLQGLQSQNQQINNSSQVLGSIIGQLQGNSGASQQLTGSLQSQVGFSGNQMQQTFGPSLDQAIQSLSIATQGSISTTQATQGTITTQATQGSIATQGEAPTPTQGPVA